MRFRLRTLMIVLAIGPPMLAGIWSFVPKPADNSDLVEWNYAPTDLAHLRGGPIIWDMDVHWDGIHPSDWVEPDEN
jgi:hypothetical protein